MARLIASTFWLAVFGGLGYGLLVGVTQSPEELKKISTDYPGVEKDPRNVISQKQKFVGIVQAAAESDKPFYLLTKEEIEHIVKTK